MDITIAKVTTLGYLPTPKRVVKPTLGAKSHAREVGNTMLDLDAYLPEKTRVEDVSASEREYTPSRNHSRASHKRERSQGLSTREIEPKKCKSHLGLVGRPTDGIAKQPSPINDDVFSRRIPPISGTASPYLPVSELQHSAPSAPGSAQTRSSSRSSSSQSTSQPQQSSTVQIEPTKPTVDAAEINMSRVPSGLPVRVSTRL
jgi:hypothetical protein